MKTLWTFLFLGGALLAQTPPTLLHQTNSNTVPTSSGIAYTLSSATTAGDTLVGVFAGSGAFVTAISGCGAWTQIADSHVNREVSIWAAPNVSGSCTSVTITANSTPTNFQINISEWAFPAALTVDKFGTGQHGANLPSTTVTSPSITTTNADDVIFVVYRFNGGLVNSGPTGTTTWTNLTGFGTNGYLPSYSVVSATGPYSATWTMSQLNSSYDCAIAAIEWAGGSGAGVRHNVRQGN